ncbi:MAG: polysaccharide deacetylase family protein [Chitinispirillaceae bacterium]|nr:polysaccharide deacetylase family protein [Chitinispirillaceae bacterium]
MRLDRSVTMLLSPVPFRRHRKIPVLMYHSISEKRSPVSHPYFETITRPPVFRRHMELLRDARYSIIRLDAIEAALSSPALTESRFAAISFDDGYDDFHSSAFPVLQSFGFPATVFLPTAFMDSAESGLEGRRHLTWKQVRELQSAGIEFGSHTINHPLLADEPEPEIVRQIHESKTVIEQQTGAAVAGFSFPYRFPEGNTRLVALLRKTVADAGYRYGVCTTIGRVSAADDRFFLKRLPVNDFDDDALFLAKCSGAYDWVHGPQRLKKRIMSWIRP